MLDPDVYNNNVLFKDAIERKETQKILIGNFNHRMTCHGFRGFLRIKVD